MSALNVASTWQSPVLLEHWQRQFLDRATMALMRAPAHPPAAAYRAIATRRRAPLLDRTDSMAA